MTHTNKLIQPDLPNRLKNARRRERRRRVREQALLGQDRPLDLREIAPHLPGLRLYDKPVVLPEPRQPVLCPACCKPLEVFAHHERVMLMCEPCLRLWPTGASSETASVRTVVRKIVPLEKIVIRLKGNEQDYHRVYYARNHEKQLAYSRNWRSSLPDGGKRYARAYYEANKEEIVSRQLENYHANKAEKQAKQAEYRKNNREKERARQRRWKQENPEKNRVRRLAYAEANRERINAQKRERRAADLEKHRAYHREYQRRKAAEKRAAAAREQAAD